MLGLSLTASNTRIIHLIALEEPVHFPQQAHTDFNDSWQKERISRMTLFSCIHERHCLVFIGKTAQELGRAERLAGGFLTQYYVCWLLVARILSLSTRASGGKVEMLFRAIL